MLREARRVPMPLGVKATWKLAVPVKFATGEGGSRVTVKSAACGPPTATLGVPVRFSRAGPVF